MLHTTTDLDEANKTPLATARSQPLEKLFKAMVIAPVGIIVAAAKGISILLEPLVLCIVPVMVSLILAVFAGIAAAKISYYTILGHKRPKETDVEPPALAIFIMMLSVVVHIGSLIWLCGGADESYDMPFWMRCVTALMTSCIVACLIMALLVVCRLCSEGRNWWIGQSHPEQEDQIDEMLEKGQAVEAEPVDIKSHDEKSSV